MSIRTELHRPKLRRRDPGPSAPDPDSEPDDCERDFVSKARAGSARLRLALLRYGVKHGLPNLSPEQCAAAVQWLEAGRIKRRKAGRKEGARPLAGKARPPRRGGAGRRTGAAAGRRESGRHGPRR
jgi:hypothetical protein